MKLKYEFAIESLGDSYVAVAVGDGADAFHGVVKLNETGKAIFELLSEETTEEAVIAALKERFEGVGEESVRDRLASLRKGGLLV